MFTTPLRSPPRRTRVLQITTPCLARYPTRRAASMRVGLSILWKTGWWRHSAILPVL